MVPALIRYYKYVNDVFYPMFSMWYQLSSGITSMLMMYFTPCSASGTGVIRYYKYVNDVFYPMFRYDEHLVPALIRYYKYVNDVFYSMFRYDKHLIPSAV